MLFHGTPVGNIASILRDGLRPGGRDHVHLSVDVPTAVATVRMAEHGHVFIATPTGCG